jgi:hypothetical protein
MAGTEWSNKRMQRSRAIEFRMVPSVLRARPADAKRWVATLKSTLNAGYILNHER